MIECVDIVEGQVHLSFNFLCELCVVRLTLTVGLSERLRRWTIWVWTIAAEQFPRQGMCGCTRWRARKKASNLSPPVNPGSLAVTQMEQRENHVESLCQVRTTARWGPADLAEARFSFFLFLWHKWKSFIAGSNYYRTRHRWS